MTTAKQVLAAIRRKYKDQPVIREVVLRDEHQQAIANRQLLETSPVRDYYAERFAKTGEPVADSVPEGWDRKAATFERRIDALLFDGHRRTAIEIKVTRADFKRDTDEKRRAWRDHTHRFVYAAPEGLLSADEMPEGCGLWEVSDFGHLGVVRRATINKNPKPLPDHLIRAMMFRVSNYERKEEAA